MTSADYERLAGECEADATALAAELVSLDRMAGVWKTPVEHSRPYLLGRLRKIRGLDTYAHNQPNQSGEHAT
jgi:hypothetical protein